MNEEAQEVIFIMVERTFKGAGRAEALLARTRNPAPVLRALGISLDSMGFTDRNLRVIVKFCDPGSRECLPPR